MSRVGLAQALLWLLVAGQPGCFASSGEVAYQTGVRLPEWRPSDWVPVPPEQGPRDSDWEVNVSFATLITRPDRIQFWVVFEGHSAQVRSLSQVQVRLDLDGLPPVVASLPDLRLVETGEARLRVELPFDSGAAFRAGHTQGKLRIGALTDGGSRRFKAWGMSLN